MHHRRRIKEFRDKQHVLEMQLEGTVDPEDAAELQSRVDAMAAVVKRCVERRSWERGHEHTEPKFYPLLNSELEGLNAIVNQHAALRKEIKQLKTQFEKQEFERVHGEGTFFEGDTDDLYKVKRENVTVSAQGSGKGEREWCF